MLDRDRLSVLTGVIVLALALTRFMETPVRPLSTTVLGSTVGINLSASALAPILIGTLGLTAAESLVRSHPSARRGDVNRTAIYWIVPASLSAAIASWLVTIEDLGLWTAGIIASAVVIPVSLAAEYLSVMPTQENGSRGKTWISEPKYALLFWGQRFLVFLAALILFTRIFDWHARTILSGTLVLFFAAALATRLLWTAATESKNALMYGLVVGMLLGQLTWVLNYWPLSSLQGGLILLLGFYLVEGLIEQFLNKRLNRQVAAEHIGVAATGLVLVALVVP